MDISFKDAKILWTGLWHKEELVNKKRRWLMQLSSQDTNQVGYKKLKRPKLSSNRFLDESFVRKDEVSSRAVKINIENYRSLGWADEKLREVQNYIVLSDVFAVQSYIMEPYNLKKFHSILDLLSNNALGLLANLVTKDKICVERTPSRLKNIIKDHFPNSPASNDMELIQTLQLLYEILINPKNFYKKQTSLLTPSLSSNLKSIRKALELVDSMPVFALISLKRILRGENLVPSFPPKNDGYYKNMLVDSIMNLCQGFILILKDGNSMPTELNRALSVIHLYFKYETKSYNALTSKFSSSSKEKVILQNQILKALWSIPNVAPYQLKHLQSKLGDDSTRFLNNLKQYLIQCLFACDEIDLPRDVSDILAILNHNSCSQTQQCGKGTIEKETEAVLNISVELKKIVFHSESDTNADSMAAKELESDNGSSSDYSQLTESDFCSNPINYQRQLTNELESTGDSMPATLLISGTGDSCDGILHCKAPNGVLHGCDEKHKGWDEESLGNFLRSTRASKKCSDVSIKELCDETSLVCYRVIDHMLNSFFSVKGEDVCLATRGCLTGRASSSKNFRGTIVI